MQRHDHRPPHGSVVADERHANEGAPNERLDDQENTRKYEPAPCGMPALEHPERGSGQSENTHAEQTRRDAMRELDERLDRARDMSNFALTAWPVLAAPGPGARDPHDGTEQDHEDCRREGPDDRHEKARFA